MSANVEAMVREGIASAKAGKRDEARVLLTKAVELDPYHEEGWLWLSGVIDAPEDQRTCLENVLAINPANEKARKGLDYLTKGPPPAPAAPPAPPPPPPPVSPPPPTEPPVVDPRGSGGSVTSVEWDFGTTETSSPSSARSVPEPSPQEYDDWVSGLQLKSNEGGSPTTSPFVNFDDAFFASGPFEDDDAAPAAGAFVPPVPESAPERPLPAAPTIAYRPPPPPDPAAEATVPAKRSPAIDDGTAVNPFAMPSRGSAAAPIPMPVELADDGFEMSSDMFPTIPKAIAPTRLPGTRERTPILLVVLALVLFLANTAAAVLLVTRLLTPA